MNLAGASDRQALQSWSLTARLCVIRLIEALPSVLIIWLGIRH